MAYHHGDLRRALLDECRVVLDDIGPTALTLRNLAKRIGVSHAAAYRHFRDKEHLLAAMSVQGFADLAARSEAATSKTDLTLGKLAAAGTAYVSFAEAHPELFKLMFSREMSHHEAVATAAHDAYGVLEALITVAQREGLVRDEDSEVMSLLLFTHIHGLARLVVDRTMPRRDFAATPILANQLAAILFRGIGTDVTRD